MTMMMTNSQFGQEDMEVLLWGLSSPMADDVGFPSIHPDQKVLQEGRGTSLEGDASPVSPCTTSSLSMSPPCHFYSPPHSPPVDLIQADKVETESDLLSLPWLGHADQLREIISDDCKEGMFSGLSWISERMDLSEFDLDTLIGPADESPTSPEDFLASLDCAMELDSDPMSTLSSPVVPSLSSAPLPSVSPFTPPPSVCSEPSITTVDEPESCVDEQDVPSPSLSVPEPQEELEIKSEPATPDPSSPSVESPSTPAHTLDLGSEVDVSVSEEKLVVTSVIPQFQKLVLSLSPTRILIVLAPKEEVAVTTTISEVIHSPSPPKSPRSRPYPEPSYKGGPASPRDKVKSLRGEGGDERAPLKTSKTKKIKKMEQNKTAATRYRQKKKTEKESLTDEYSRLERKNMELSGRVESMTREIEYLKELMAEVCVARKNKRLLVPTPSGGAL